MGRVLWHFFIHSVCAFVFVMKQEDGRTKTTFNITHAVKKPQLDSSKVMNDAVTLFVSTAIAAKLKLLLMFADWSLLPSLLFTRLLFKTMNFCDLWGGFFWPNGLVVACVTVVKALVNVEPYSAHYYL